jgi:hypothetical protein
MRHAQLAPQATLDPPAADAVAPSDASFGQPAAPSSQDENAPPRPFAETLCL